MKPWKQNLQRLREQTAAMASNRPGRTLLEIVGKDRLVIEHHLGIVSYSTEQILVAATYGQLRICGNRLNLCCMSREQLCVTGRVDSVELIGGTKDGSVE